MKRSVTRVIVGLAAAALTTFGVATQAQAAPTTHQYLNNYYSECLDNNTSHQVYLHSCNSGNFQRWTHNNNSEMKNVSTSFCLDSDSGGHVTAGNCNNGNFQKWRLTSDWHWANVATGLCLDVNASKTVYTHACNNGDRQLWIPQSS